jgi:flavin reductase (DIM6/NTAB) family NADH-FMN oxidoreductase RutF
VAAGRRLRGRLPAGARLRREPRLSTDDSTNDSTDDKAFDTLIASLDPAMAVVTTASGGERAGCLVGFHAQCSITPHRYVVWLSKANHTFRVALHARHFAVHFLADGSADEGSADERAEDLPRLFGTVSGDTTDKFAGVAWSPGPGGVPVLRDCPNRFTAQRVALLDEGSDHVCLVLEPMEVVAPGPFRPLRLSQVAHLQPGHEAEERPKPAAERSAAG